MSRATGLVGEIARASPSSHRPAELAQGVMRIAPMPPGAQRTEGRRRRRRSSGDRVQSPGTRQAGYPRLRAALRQIRSSDLEKNASPACWWGSRSSRNRNCPITRPAVSANGTRLRARLQPLSGFRRARAPHARVHDAGKRAARAFNAGDLAAPNWRFVELEEASGAVISALDDLIAQTSAAPGRGHAAMIA